MSGRLVNLSNVFVVVGIALLVAAGSFIGSTVMAFLALEQGRANEQRFDCAVSVFAGTEPPSCARIIEDLRRQGIFPPRGTEAHP